MYSMHVTDSNVGIKQAILTTISMDRTLLNEFREAVIKLCLSFEPDTIEKVHSILFSKLDVMNLYVMLASYPAYNKTEV